MTNYTTIVSTENNSFCEICTNMFYISCHMSCSHVCFLFQNEFFKYICTHYYKIIQPGKLFFLLLLLNTIPCLTISNKISVRENV